MYTPTASQLQLPDITRPQFVLDYEPNQAFHPKALAEGTLGKLRGRLWIDAIDHHMLRIDIILEKDVNVIGGVLIKVFHGGTVEYSQRRIDEGQYSLANLRIHLRIRELLVKSKSIDAELTASKIRILSPGPNGPEAITAQLAMQVILH